MPKEIEIEVNPVEPIVNEGKSFLPIPITDGIELMANYLHDEPESFTATGLFHALKNFNGFHQMWLEGNKVDALEHLFLAYMFDEKGVSVFADKNLRDDVAEEIVTRQMAEPYNFKITVLAFWARHSWCSLESSKEQLYTERMSLLDEAIAISEASDKGSIAYRVRPNLIYHKGCEYMFQELPEKGVIEFTACLQHLERDGFMSMWPHITTHDGNLGAIFRYHMILEARLNVGRALSGLKMDKEDVEMAAIKCMQDYVDHAREDSCIYDVALCDLFMANFYLDIIRKKVNPGETSLPLLDKVYEVSTRRIPIFDHDLIDHPAFTVAAEIRNLASVKSNLRKQAELRNNISTEKDKKDKEPKIKKKTK